MPVPADRISDIVTPSTGCVPPPRPAARPSAALDALGEPESRWPGRLASASEAVVLALACLAPWAYGSVDAWAELGLNVGILALAVLGALAGRPRRCGAAAAVAALAALGLVQAAPLPATLLRAASPGQATLRAAVLPARPERVAGDPAAPVALPSPTLSQDPEGSLSAAARLAAAFILFVAVLGLERPAAAFRRFALALAVNAALLSLFALVQWLSWNGKIYWVRPSPVPGNPWYSGGPFICHNHLAAALNLGLGMALGLVLAARQGDPWFRGRGGNLWPGFLAAVAAVGLIASHSRGGVLAAAVAASATALAARRLRLRTGAGLAVAAATVPLFLLVAGTWSPFQRMATLADPGADLRWQVWRGAVAAWWTRPVWGTGLGSFAAAVARFDPTDQGRFFSRADNEYLDVLVEGGLLGLGLALAALAGVGRLARRALADAPSPRDRALVLGGLFAGLALVLHWFCDHSLHIPGVAVAAVALSAYLCRLGLGAAPLRRPGSSPDVLGILLRPALPLVALLVVGHSYRQARAEAQLRDAGLPLPGVAMPSPDLEERPGPVLERERAALERALRDRPDWAEGHVRLGRVLLSLYARDVRALLASASVAESSADGALLAQPLWLHGIVHTSDAERVGNLLNYEPVRDRLAPAARQFLEARRCCPVLALPHAELASLDYLLEGGDRGPRYAERALRLAGSDGRLLEFTAVAAAQSGDLGLAARCWRRALDVSPGRLPSVADAALPLLGLDAVLAEVLPPRDGRLAVALAARLPGGDDGKPTRDRGFLEALGRVDADGRLEPAERHRLRGEALAALDRRDESRTEFERALELDPGRSDLRMELVGWLLAWDRASDAHRHVTIGLGLDPSHPGLGGARLRVADALARGPSAGGSPGRGGEK